jgi:aminoglycoside phosphotransferase (APT) family kinase protein
VAAAIARQLDVRVDEVERQLRWRPTWFVRAHRDGQPLNLVVRGDRVDTALVPLRHEMAFQQLLQEHGLPVPAVHGWNDEIGAIVMDFVPGRPDFTDVPDSDRNQIVDEYLQALARLHALDIGPFVEADLLRPTQPDQSGTVSAERLEAVYRARKRHPHPFLEFCLGWIHRNPPRSHGRISPIVWDSGQFHHADGHLQAMLDLEFGHIGDPMEDLAVWRMRSTLIPYGHFPTLYARYEELTGTKVDLEAIQRHYFVSTLANELSFAASVRDPEPDSDLMTNLQWNSETNLMTTEALAEILDIELPTVDTPAPRITRADPAFRQLVHKLREAQTQDSPALQYELRRAFRMSRHLQRHNEIGDALTEADLDDIHQLLGTRPENWQEGDKALEEFVLADATEGRHDAELLRLFHRRNLRTHMLLGPQGSSMTKHYPAPRFDQP